MGNLLLYHAAWPGAKPKKPIGVHFKDKNWSFCFLLLFCFFFVFFWDSFITQWTVEESVFFSARVNWWAYDTNDYEVLHGFFFKTSWTLSNNKALFSGCTLHHKDNRRTLKCSRFVPCTIKAFSFWLLELLDPSNVLCRTQRYNHFNHS